VIASTSLLVLGILALIGVVNALHPARTLLLALPSWIAAWVTVELAPFLVVFDVAAAAVLIALGGLEHPSGWIGLGGLLVAAAVAIPRIVKARRTVLDLGEIREELDPDEAESPYPRIHIAFPFLVMRRSGVRRVRGVEYAPGGRLRKLDVYLPTQPARGPRPAIVQVHGGGWVLGSRHEQGIPLLTHLAANGWVGFNIDYRLSPFATMPEHVIDVKRAIAWVREHADELDIDPSRIALTGGSAGGHLTALAALTADDDTLQPGFEDADTSVAAAVPFYGVYDFTDPDTLYSPGIRDWLLPRVVFKKTLAEAPEQYRAASPYHRIHAGAPPFLVFHGDEDSLVPIEDARAFVDRLAAVSSNPARLVELPGAEHAFDLFPSLRTARVVEGIERFLRATVKPPPEDPGATSSERASTVSC
jgi:acetyl esterase/lipase